MDFLFQMEEVYFFSASLNAPLVLLSRLAEEAEHNEAGVYRSSCTGSTNESRPVLILPSLFELKALENG